MGGFDNWHLPEAGSGSVWIGAALLLGLLLVGVFALFVLLGGPGPASHVWGRRAANKRVADGDVDVPAPRRAEATPAQPPVHRSRR